MSVDTLLEKYLFSFFRGKGIMKFSSSLKLNHIFQRLYKTSGQANGHLVLYARKNRTSTNRVGITVSKKLGKANVRNRVRRRHKPKSFKEANDLIDRYIYFYNNERIQNKTGVAPLTLRHSA